VKTSFSGKKKSVVEKAIEFFGCSENSGAFISEEFFAEALGNGKPGELIDKLRSMRWDVRSTKTHPTIQHDSILCTYPFPLLSGKAQLERKLSLA
jgi:DNA (cytosine-5)-methyltransferase 1